MRLMRDRIDAHRVYIYEKIASLRYQFYRALNRVKFGSIDESILSSRKDYVKLGLYRQDANSILVSA